MLIRSPLLADEQLKGGRDCLGHVLEVQSTACSTAVGLWKVRASWQKSVAEDSCSPMVDGS
jgi:hypothetical protein